MILYAPKQITHVQTVISEHDRNGAKVGHIAIYLTKKGWGWGTEAWRMQRQQRKGKVFGNTDQIVSVWVRAFELLCVWPTSEVTGCYSSFKNCLDTMELLLTQDFLQLFIFPHFLRTEHKHTHNNTDRGISHPREIETDIAVTRPYQHIWHRVSAALISCQWTA